jgi:hypothetical protein
MTIIDAAVHLFYHWYIINVSAAVHHCMWRNTELSEQTSRQPKGAVLQVELEASSLSGGKINAVDSSNVQQGGGGGGADEQESPTENMIRVSPTDTTPWDGRAEIHLPCNILQTARDACRSLVCTRLRVRWTRFCLCSTWPVAQGVPESAQSVLAED